MLRFVTYLPSPILLSSLLVTLILAAVVVADDSANKPLKVFVLAGQSNMQGHAHQSTIDAMQYNPDAAPLLDDIRDAGGNPIVCDNVWIASLGSAEQERFGQLAVGYGAEGRGPKIGPEYTFGIYMSKLLKEPILIIKTAWGGKNLHTDFRPPSAGPFEFNAQQIQNFEKQNKDFAEIKREKELATGAYYRQMVQYIQSVLKDIKRVVPDYQESQGYELAGFVWFQGWNDMVDRDFYPNRDQSGGYDEYSHLLAAFIRDVRKDLDSPELPFVIGVMGAGGPTKLYGPEQQRYQKVHQNFRDAMAAPASYPEFQNNVTAVLTENYWDLQVVALRQREQSLKPQVDELNASVKAGEKTKAEAQDAINKLYEESFSPEELTVLRTSVSNAEFHYLGSAGIITQIGKAFAEAMAAHQ